MPDIEGRVEQLLVTPEKIPGNPVEEVQAAWEGFVGDKHYGLTRKAGSSQKQYPKGTEIRNVRQISIVSVEELNQVAKTMELPNIEPAWVGANVLLSGIDNLTQLPSGTRLFFEHGVGIVIDGENLPCTTAGGCLQDQFPDREGLTIGFPKSALGKRGLVAWVEHPGVIHTGEKVRVRLAQDIRT